MSLLFRRSCPKSLVVRFDIPGRPYWAASSTAASESLMKLLVGYWLVICRYLGLGFVALLKARQVRVEYCQTRQYSRTLVGKPPASAIILPQSLPL